ncbi:hypothetical protein C4D60_Mb05t00280 [Musa balbisiana]|uniref:Uncharacterized protein n=1 Tax=Musa balbisiana TaxID=52838 RepID=A0A4S8JSL9_MUSBA|nr:hypothetical protein C4D60_Mb05t00280 [Musa balbisiana]
MASGLLRSKAGMAIRNVARFQGHAPQCTTYAAARLMSSTAPLQSESTEVRGFKGHDMLAPFTAGWQTTDLHPLVIEKSEDLAKEILEIFTARKMGKVFFTNSGSEANDSQVKLVWYYNNALGRPNKKKFIARETEEEFSTRLANNLENLILKEGPDTIAAFIAEPVMGAGGVIPPPKTYFEKIAAFIAEPVMGAGGVIPPPKTYFEKIQAVVKKYDILFIADEVITAFGRLGTMFGCDKYKIQPDLVSIAKLVGNECNNQTMSEREIPSHVSAISPKFQEGIRTFSGSPIIGEIRGTGLILGTEFADNKSPNDPFPPEWGVGAIFGLECEKRGMLIRVAGDNTMMSPPLVMTPDEVDELVSIYGDALKSTEEKVAELKSKRTQ